jgi:hypothetical protein
LRSRTPRCILIYRTARAQDWKGARLADEVSETSARATLRSRIDELPQGFLVRVRAGFRDLTGVERARRSEALTALVDKFAKRATVSNTDLGRRLGVAPPTAAGIIAAVSFVFGAVVDLDVTPGDFVSLGRGKVFEEGADEAADELAQIVVGSRARLKDQLEESTLAGAVLPSLSSFGIEVDLRLKFSETDELVRTAPVAVMHVDTDGENQEMWLQLNRADVAALIVQLEIVRKRMDIAADLLKQAPKP